MSVSNETQEKIKAFAKEQAGKYLSNAELSYFERRERKSGRTKRNIQNKMERFKFTSDQTAEAREDLAVFMNDYIADLMLQGHSEEDAFLWAERELAAESGSGQSEKLEQRFLENYDYYDYGDPSAYEAIGLYYAGFTILGLVIGTAAGIILGLYVFRPYFWIVFTVSALAGMFAGAACGMLKHASIVKK